MDEIVGVLAYRLFLSFLSHFLFYRLVSISTLNLSARVHDFFYTFTRAHTRGV